MGMAKSLLGMTIQPVFCPHRDILVTLHQARELRRGFAGLSFSFKSME